MELLTTDVEQLQVMEASGQLSEAQRAQVAQLCQALLAAQELVIANVWKEGDGNSSWEQQKRWIAAQVRKWDEVRRDIASARDAVIRAAQLLHFRLSSHLLHSLHCAAAAGDEESRTEDAQQLLQYVKDHQHEHDGAISGILQQLQGRCVDPTQHAARTVSQLLSVSQDKEEVKEQLTGMMQALSQQCSAAIETKVISEVSEPPIDLSTLAHVREFQVRKSLRIDHKHSLGKGSSGVVLKAQCLLKRGAL